MADLLHLETNCPKCHTDSLHPFACEKTLIGHSYFSLGEIHVNKQRIIKCYNCHSVFAFNIQTQIYIVEVVNND